MKKNICLSLCLITMFSLAAHSRTLVLPFMVDGKNHTSTRWLGKAISVYLISGLAQNQVPVFSEEEVQSILNQIRIPFPFDITKATAIKIAKQNQADYLLWGKILYNQDDPKQLSVQPFAVTLSKVEQKYLPLIKGNSQDIYKIQEEILKQTLRHIAPAQTTVILPAMRLPLSDFEQVTKSLLVTDREKKLDMLRPLSDANPLNDFADFELGKIFIEKSDWAQAETYLKQIPDDSPLAAAKSFLLSLIAFQSGNLDAAQNQFIALQQQNLFPSETNNNLGVIYFLKGDFPTAGKCLRYSLYLKKDPEIYLNNALLLQAMKTSEQARNMVIEALENFPDDEPLIEAFSYFLATASDRDTLAAVFKEYILGSSLGGDEWPAPAAKPVMKDPFHFKALTNSGQEYRNYFNDARSLALEEEWDDAQKKAEAAMEINPFVSECHQLLAQIFLQKKNFLLAEMYGRSALFLKENAENYLSLIRTYQAAKLLPKLRETIRTAKEKFPDHKDIQALPNTV